MLNHFSVVTPPWKPDPGSLARPACDIHLNGMGLCLFLAPTSSARSRRGASHQCISVQPHQTCPTWNRNGDILASRLETWLSAATCNYTASHCTSPLCQSYSRAWRRKHDGVQGIATGDVFRRMCRVHSCALAKQWTPVFHQATRPHQFALQARACTNAMLGWRSSFVTKRTSFARIVYDIMSQACFLASLQDTMLVGC